MYTAIVADIKSSRSIRQRYAAQTRLQAVLARVNEDYAKQIAANFVNRHGLFLPDGWFCHDVPSRSHEPHT